MSKRTFTVKLEIEASSEDQILNMGVGKLIDDFRTLSFEIVDPEKRHYEVRCRRDKDYNGLGPCFVLEGKWSDEDEWDCIEAYEIDEHDKINYHILGFIKDQKKTWGRNVEII